MNGVYDTGIPPTAHNMAHTVFSNGSEFSFQDAQEAACSIGAKPLKTIHLVNCWRSNTLLRQIVMSPALGKAVARLMRWEACGCRVAQDQLWIKPPHSGPLTFHRDTPYLDFVPKEVCTVWIPFDDTTRPNVGTLEYCRGSHRWKGGRRGSAKQFYSADYKALLRTAAREHAMENGVPNSTNDAPLEIEPVLGASGCCSFHDGNTWHGSGCNTTDQWRRGLGIHYVRGDATLSKSCGKLWAPFRAPDGGDILLSEYFPLVAEPLT